MIMITSQANLLQSLGWALLNSLWQMALLWVVYQLITGITRGARSSFRSGLASVLLVTGFGLFLFTFASFYSGPDSNQAVIPVSFLNTGNSQTLNNWLQKSLSVASFIYLFLLLLPVSGFVRNYRYAQVTRNYGLSKMDVRWRIFVKNVSLLMGIKKQVRIWISEFVSSPVTIGFLKPVILVPLAAINYLSPQQMEAVLLHELSHIRRSDYLVNLLINFIQTILYFNPFVKAFVKTVEREREKSCDEMVLQFQYDSYEYASALLTLEKTNRVKKFFVLGATGNKNNRNDLLQRVELIMGVSRKQSFSFHKLAGMLAGLIFILALNAFLFLSKPSGGKTSGTYTSVYSPFNFLVPGTSAGTVEWPAKTSKNIAAASDISSPETEKTFPVVPVKSNPDIPVNPAIIHADYEPAQIVQLKKYEEAQVKAAMDASKKVLENEEWKALQVRIADVFTQKQKEELKASYQKAIEKMDWNNWENKLRLAYDKVDWERVNRQLSIAVNNIRIDSLQNVYSQAINELNNTSEKLSQNNLPGIPDTDITIKTIEETKLQVEKTLNRLKAVRNKKIVHL